MNAPRKITFVGGPLNGITETVPAPDGMLMELTPSAATNEKPATQLYLVQGNVAKYQGEKGYFVELVGGKYDGTKVGGPLAEDEPWTVTDDVQPGEVEPTKYMYRVEGKKAYFEGIGGATEDSK